MDVSAWEPRRVVALAAALPEGTTPPGTRGRILKASLGLFARQGFAGSSIRQIATAASINSATLYAHYPSKEHVLAELVLVGHRELLSRLTAALAAGPPAVQYARDPATRQPRSAPATAQLTALVRAHVLAHTEFPLLAVVTNTELHALSPALAAQALELRQECRRLLIEVLERGCADGEFECADILLAATAIGSMGMQVAHWFGPDQPYSGAEIADRYAQFARRIVGASC